MAGAIFCLGLGIVAPALAGVETVAGPVDVAPGNRSLFVTAPYTGDDNGNNTLHVEWGQSGGDFSLGTTTLPHSPSPYTPTISDLDICKIYQVRITFLDADGAPGPVVLTDLTPNNPILHNSISTGSEKWAPNGWGIDVGKYGEFGCSTCHTRNATNIKRIRGILAAPDGTDHFPIEEASGTVTFTDTRDGTASFGDDAGGHAASQKICEGCHSLTAYHRHNTAGQSSLDHYNRADCIRCHRHNSGFGHGGGSGTGCIECHGHDAGYEYESGKFSQGEGSFLAHSTHTENDSDDLKGPHVVCGECHDTSNFPWFKSGTDGNGDGKYSLAETDVCDACHSPGGVYNGVTDAAIGAKVSWSNGVYAGDGTLRSGKEAWCGGCHDGVPAVISGQSAPDKMGDNGTYGYYVTGHGRDGVYPRMSWQDSAAAGNPGASRGCLDCHDGSQGHITIGSSNTRLKAGYDNDQNNSNCNNCHISGGSAATDPRFYTESSDYEGSAHGGKLCTDCHDVHGSTGAFTAMTKADRQGLCSLCHANGGHPGAGSAPFTASGKSYTLQCVSCHNVHIVTGTYDQADQDKSPVTKFSDNLNVWGDAPAEKMNAYAGTGTYRTPEGETFTGAQLPDYAAFCTDCHSQPGDPPFGIDWSNDPHGKNAANMPNGYGTCPNWFGCGKAFGWDNDDCVAADKNDCWPVVPRGAGDQIFSREEYTHTERTAGANFTLSCTDCHTGHGTGKLGRPNVNGGSFTSNWNSMCDNCHFYYSDWHAGMGCGNASCHVSERMNNGGGATPHEMNAAHGSGATRAFDPALVLNYRFENNLGDAGNWQMDGKWMDDISGTFAAGKSGQALVLDGGKNVQVGTENANWSTDAGYHGTWVYTEMKFNTTLEAWVYPTDSAGSEYVIFSKHVGVSNDGSYVLALKKIGGTLRAAFNMAADNNGIAQDGRSGLRGAYSSVGVPLNKWTHVAAAFDRNGPDRNPSDLSVGRIRIYVNGEDVTTSDGSGNNMQPGANETSIYAYSENSPWNQGICFDGQWCASEFSIGGFYGWQNEFIGRLDDAKVWNVTKDATYFAAYDAQAGPYISHAEGLIGSNQITLTFSEGVYTNTGASGALAPADFILTDTGGNNPRTITGVTHAAGSSVAVVTTSAPLIVADITADTLAAASNAIYDNNNLAAGAETVTIGLSSQCPASPTILQFDEASGSSYVMDTQNILYGAVYGGASSLTGSAYSGGGDGSSRYILFDYNSTCLQATEAMTIEARIKPTGIPNDTTTNYVRRILARDGGSNYQLSVWRNNTAFPGYSAPAGEASVALWINVADTHGGSAWKPVLTNYTGAKTGLENNCPVVSDHWYQVRAVWNTDKPGGTPGQFFLPADIYIDDQGTDGADTGENWSGYVNCADTDQSLIPDTSKFYTNDLIVPADGNFALGTNTGAPANNLFNGLIDWVTWKDTADSAP